MKTPNTSSSRRSVLRALAATPALPVASSTALGGLGALGASLTPGYVAAAAGVPTAPPFLSGGYRGRVLVVGGGYGGATAARYLRRWGGPGIDVTLVEREPSFISCPLSNLVLVDARRIEELTVGYDGLRAAGIRVLQDEVAELDPVSGRARLARHGLLAFDRVIVSPGIDFNFGAVEGLHEAAQQHILHAWKAGPQTVALRRQLEAMPDGGVFVITIPLAPYRCPPGPYERVCQVAHYFKQAKPKSKIVVLDANPDITSKKGLFLAEWNGQYKGMIDYQPNVKVTELDAASRTAISEFGDRVKADVLNLVPPHGAAQIARRTGLIDANNRWCTVDWVTMESKAVPGVHVLGDATLAGPAMPKSGHMANQHGKAAAAAIVELFNGRKPQPLTMANTCYSFVDDRRVMHVSSVHRYDAGKAMIEPVAGAGGLSTEASELEGVYANSWARNIWNDMLG